MDTHYMDMTVIRNSMDIGGEAEKEVSCLCDGL